MGTTAQKLTYLNDTKQLLKNGINSIGGNITSQTTFRQYATELDSIYASLPKVSGTGSNIQLTPTKKGRITSQINGDTLQDGTPTPDTPIAIQSVTGTQNINVCGKNLFNPNVETKSAYPINNSSAIGNTLKYNSSTATTSYVNCMYVEAGVAYTLSWEQSTQSSTNIRVSSIVDGNNILLEYFNSWFSNGNPVTFTPNNSGYLILAMDKNSENIQIEKGSTATTYEAYSGETYDINLGDIELNKIGDYKDYITGTPDNWSIVNNVGKITLNGTENWSNPRNSNVYQYNANFLSIALSTAYCNYAIQQLINSNIVSNIENNKFVLQTPTDYTNSILYFRNDNIVADITAWKTWLSNNNVEVVYLLATPTTTPITNTELIEDLNAFYYAMSKNGETNISVDGNLPIILDVSALKDTE